MHVKLVYLSDLMGVDPALGNLSPAQERFDTWYRHTDAHTWTEFCNVTHLLISFPLLIPERAGYVMGKCLLAVWG